MRWYEVDSFLESETVVQLKERIKRLEDRLKRTAPSPPPSYTTPPGDPAFDIPMTIHVDPGPAPDAAAAIRQTIERSNRESRIRR